MRDLSAFLIPRSLDEPERILFFTYLELGMLLFPIIVGVNIGHTNKGVLGGIIALILYKKLNPTNKGYSVTHLIYWYFPSWFFKLSSLPPSFIRIFL
ncbi:MAG: type IV conjugative transfer system protein TraL [Endomicrobium sp.]|jgi:type IV conjugative transfer system protein TraL|nr:type IV conjugative transfer system protein TraL [Endomicrobium sp.]